MDARKQDTRRKIQLGGLVRAAGLDHERFDEMTLLGALLSMRAVLDQYPDRAEGFRRQALAYSDKRRREKEPELVAVAVRFPKAPAPQARDAIKAFGLSFVNEREWWGLVKNTELLQTIAAKWGGSFYVRDES